MTDILERLSAPFPPDRVSWRVGSTNKKNWSEGKPRRGQPLCYIDARDVMARLDEVVGADSWQNRYEVHGTKTLCYLSLRIGGSWITKADGAGDSDMEAEKGALSDAFKRAAVHWGIGRYLYDVSAGWIDLDDYWGIPGGEYKKLRALLPGEPVQKPKAASRSTYSALSLGLKQCGTLEDLQAYWMQKQALIATLPEDWRRDLMTEKDDLKTLFANRREAAE